MVDTHDARNQLVGETSGTDSYVYSYDAGGNLVSVQKNGEVIKSYTDGKKRSHLYSDNPVVDIRIRIGEESNEENEFFYLFIGRHIGLRRKRKRHNP